MYFEPVKYGILIKERKLGRFSHNIMLCKNNGIAKIYKSTKIKFKYFRNTLFLKDVFNFWRRVWIFHFQNFGFFYSHRYSMVSFTPPSFALVESLIA